MATVRSSFRQDGCRWQVSIFGEGAKGHGGAKTSASRRKWRSVRVSHSELMLMAMADAHDTIVLSRTIAAVKVKRVVVLASRPYDNDGPG